MTNTFYDCNILERTWSEHITISVDKSKWLIDKDWHLLIILEGQLMRPVQITIFTCYKINTMKWVNVMKFWQFRLNSLLHFVLINDINFFFSWYKKPFGCIIDSNHADLSRYFYWIRFYMFWNFISNNHSRVNTYDQLVIHFIP